MASADKPESTAKSTKELMVLEYQGHKVLEITFRGKRCWILADLEASLDYGPTKLGGLIRDEWSREFIEGKHFDVIRGDELRALKNALTLTRYSGVSANTRSVTVVYQEGLDLIILKTHKPQGQALRAVLVDHVIPQLRETGSATLPGAPPAIDIEALADAVAKRLDPSFKEIQKSSIPAMVLSGTFRKNSISHKIQDCVVQAMKINPSVSARSWATTFRNLLQGICGFGGTGCRWDLVPVDTYLKAIAELEGMLSLLGRLAKTKGSGIRQQTLFDVLSIKQEVRESGN